MFTSHYCLYYGGKDVLKFFNMQNPRSQKAHKNPNNNNNNNNKQNKKQTDISVGIIKIAKGY